jgi:UDP-N-acetyl-D-mannosaminuronic acid dehydrogenase
MKICVLGLGYIGLPTSLLLAQTGNNVLGIDIKNQIIEQLNRGILPFTEPGLEELFKKAKNNFQASNIVQSSQVYIIAVPTPLESDMKMADLTAVKNASIAISKVIKDEQIVILESTVPPGTSEHLILPILQGDGVKTIYFAHCPERAIPGRTLHEMVYNDRIIGGLDMESSEKVKQIYSSFIKGNIFLTDAKTAEFVKLMENTYRDINIALANEFSLLAEEVGINVWDAIRLANKHPRVDILKPGPGVGGHCIAIDPLFLAEKCSKARIVTLAREINSSMPIHVIKMIQSMVMDIKSPTITLLGLAYKGNVDDVRESPTFKIKKIAENEGMSVKLYDPLIHDYPGNALTVEEATKNSDCLVLIADHDLFKKIDPKQLTMRHKNLVDTRNILNHDLWRNAGYQIKILGVRNPKYDSYEN